MKKNSCLISNAFETLQKRDACTTILVDADATIDGSYIIARNDDSSPVQSKVFLLHPERNTEGMIFKANRNQFTYKLPAHAFKYSSIADGLMNKEPSQMTYGSAGFNEKGVGISATETITANEKSLKIDPYLPLTGVTEDSITDVILPYATSARDGVLRLGKIVEEIGAGEGCGVAFIDQDEVWYFETGCGHQWLAAKLPKGQYFVTANQARLRNYDPKDTENYLASPTLISFATETGLYNPGLDGDFNFEKVYNLHEKSDMHYNYPRVYSLQEFYNPHHQNELWHPNDFPVFMKPEKKFSVADVRSGLRNTYQNLGKQPYSIPPDNTYRPISVFYCQQSHILQTRPDMPIELSDVEYFSYGMASISLYLPIFTNAIENVPEEFSRVTDNKADNFSAQWRFRKLQTLVLNNYYTYAPMVQEAFIEQEKKFDTQQHEMEEKYLAIYQKDPKSAKQLIIDFQKQVFTETLLLVEDLTNRLFTQMALDLNNTYRFKG